MTDVLASKHNCSSCAATPARVDGSSSKFSTTAPNGDGAGGEGLMGEIPLSNGYQYAGAAAMGMATDENGRSEEAEEAMRRRGSSIWQQGSSADGASRAEGGHVAVVALMLEALRRSGLSCHAPSAADDPFLMDIGWPTNVRHVAHVTFDPFHGFLGLPPEFQREVPRRVPSASVSVFGVSAESMQCSYDGKGNSVPTILLLLQERLYDQGGLKAEGIFRINAENSQEEHVRERINSGIVPYDIDVHCLAGLIKAWFRELPKGVLDSLSPEQVMACQTEEQAVAMVKTLPPMEGALLDWGINLMADVVQHEHFNKMNAHNIAMVFAPNMTQMSDPLTALMHAVQVMNLLKTLILRTLRERAEASLDPIPASSCTDPPSGHGDDHETPSFSVAGRTHAPVDLRKEDGNKDDSVSPFRSGSLHYQPHPTTIGFAAATISRDLFARSDGGALCCEEGLSTDSQEPFSHGSSSTDDESNSLITSPDTPLRDKEDAQILLASPIPDLVHHGDGVNASSRKSDLLLSEVLTKMGNLTHRDEIKADLIHCHTDGSLQPPVADSIRFEGKQKPAQEDDHLSVR